MSFKEDWLKTDEHCVACGNVTKVARGFNKQNLKRLVFAKPTIQDIITLFMIVMILFIAWRYNVEVAAAQAIVQDPTSICQTVGYNSAIPRNTINLSNISFYDIVT